MKRGTPVIAGAIVAATLLSAALPPGRVLVWNVTESVPRGLYYIGDAHDLEVGERAAIDPSLPLRRYLAVRGYLPQGLPLLKEIAALPGDTVCREGAEITVNGKRLGTALAADRRGRPLPVWHGCRTLAGDEIFAMNRHAPGSFDGRYFGPTRRSHVLGRAIPVWTDETGNGERRWFASPCNPPITRTNEGDAK